MAFWSETCGVACALLFLLGNAAAENAFYVAFNAKTGQCYVMVTQPDGQTMKMLGEGPYSSYDEAAEAMERIPECVR
jgi:hypothetical protein